MNKTTIYRHINIEINRMDERKAEKSKPPNTHQQNERKHEN